MKTKNGFVFNKITGKKHNSHVQIKLLALIVVVILGFTGCSSFVSKDRDMASTEAKMADNMKENTTKGKDMKSGKTMELDFTLKDAKGNTHTLSQSMGKKVYIKFWATWCSICMSGMNDLVEFSRDKAGDDKVVVITIVSPGTRGEMTTENFKSWYQKQGYDFTVLLDEGGNIARQYGVRGYPTSVFINTDGIVAKIQPGHLSNSDIDTTLGALK